MGRKLAPTRDVMAFILKVAVCVPRRCGKVQRRCTFQRYLGLKRGKGWGVEAWRGELRSFFWVFLDEGADTTRQGTIILISCIGGSNSGALADKMFVVF